MKSTDAAQSTSSLRHGVLPEHKNVDPPANMLADHEKDSSWSYQEQSLLRSKLQVKRPSTWHCDGALAFGVPCSAGHE